MKEHRKEKKVGARLFTVFLAVCLLLAAATSWAMAEEEGDSGYQNPRDIIIQAPEPNYSTAARQVSIYGASDYDYPLYMNGEKVETTESGFFARYVTLSQGKNTFVFTNNDKTKTVTITRRQASSGSSGGSGGTKVNIWGADVKPKYATAKGHNISRMARPGADGEKLLMPLAKGTAAQITGDAGNLYRLLDGTFVYKSNVAVSDGRLPKSVVSAMEFTPLTPYSCTEVRLKIDSNALYNLEMLPGRASLTLYNTRQEAAIPELGSNKILRSVTVMSDGGGSDGNAVYSLNFKDDAPVLGYYVEFQDGYMIVGFKQRPVINGKDLTGMRIYLDAGHGGADTGSQGAAGLYGPAEKDINLSIARSVQSYLEGKGARVITTRTEDTTVSLPDRAYRAAMEKPDLCLSIHCNSLPVTTDYNKVRGLLTFYSLDHGGDAAVINQGIADNMGIEAKPPRHSNLAMTRMTGSPAVLFESAFMSNPDDYQWLIKSSVQERLGLAAGKAVETYISRIGVLKDIVVTIDGAPLDIADQPPVIRNSRALVPVKAIFEALGAEVSWDADAQTVTADKGSARIRLIIGSPEMAVTENGIRRTVTLDAPAGIINGRTMVPVKAVSEALNAAVDWDGAERNVIITTAPAS